MVSINPIPSARAALFGQLDLTAAGRMQSVKMTGLTRKMADEVVMSGEGLLERAS
jgi:hypothetical protein